MANREVYCFLNDSTILLDSMRCLKDFFLSAFNVHYEMGIIDAFDQLMIVGSVFRISGDSPAFSEPCVLEYPENPSLFAESDVGSD